MGAGGGVGVMVALALGAGPDAACATRGDEAGEHGRKAGARRLVLTHLSDELDAVWAEEEAERAFGGPVEIAREGAVYEL